MTVPVTGAPGNVGTLLMEALWPPATQDEWPLSTRPPVRAALGGHGLEVIRFDFTDPASWPAALARVERMFLLRPRSCRGFAATCTRPWTRPPRPGRARELSSIQGPSASGWCPTGPSRTSGALADDLAFVRPAYFMQNLSTTTPPSSAGATSSGSGRYGRTAFVDARDLAAGGALTSTGHEGAASTPTARPPASPTMCGGSLAARRRGCSLSGWSLRRDRLARKRPAAGTDPGVACPRTGPEVAFKLGHSTLPPTRPGPDN